MRNISKKRMSYFLVVILSIITLALMSFINFSTGTYAYAFTEQRHSMQRYGYSIEYSIDRTTGDIFDTRVNRTICISENFCDRAVIVTIRQAYSADIFNLQDFNRSSHISFDAIIEHTYNTRNAAIKFNQILSLQLSIPSKQAVLDAIYQLEQLDKVLAAEPKFFNAYINTPNIDGRSQNAEQSNSSGDLWGLERINAFDAQYLAYSHGKGVKIGFIDGGQVRQHTSLGERNLPGNYSGFYNFDPHPLQVAGVAAGADTGVAPQAYVVSLCNDSGRGFIATLDFAIGMGIRIINVSFGWELVYFLDDILYQPSAASAAAIRNFSRAGGVIVAAAGNENRHFSQRTRMTYPAGYATWPGVDNMIVVGASNQADRRAWYGDPANINWDSPNGSAWSATSVCVFAPGDAIYTTTLTMHWYCDDCFEYYYVDNYTYMLGTSVAAPVVAILRNAENRLNTNKNHIKQCTIQYQNV